jgi:hypothetical protein
MVNLSFNSIYCVPASRCLACNGPPETLLRGKQAPVELRKGIGRKIPSNLSQIPRPAQAAGPESGRAVRMSGISSLAILRTAASNGLSSREAPSKI